MRLAKPAHLAISPRNSVGWLQAFVSPRHVERPMPLLLRLGLEGDEPLANAMVSRTIARLQTLRRP